MTCVGPMGVYVFSVGRGWLTPAIPFWCNLFIFMLLQGGGYNLYSREHSIVLERLWGAIRSRLFDVLGIVNEKHFLDPKLIAEFCVKHNIDLTPDLRGWLGFNLEPKPFKPSGGMLTLYHRALPA
jgi:hypothetical protein